jgi:type IV conjugative transfer system protein TraL
MNKRHLILYTIDRAIRFLLWTKGELALILGPLVSGLIFDAFVIGCIWTGIDIWAIRSFKRHLGVGLLKALLYWLFPPVKKFKGWPPSHVEHFIG